MDYNVVIYEKLDIQIQAGAFLLQLLWHTESNWDNTYNYFPKEGLKKPGTF